MTAPIGICAADNPLCPECGKSLLTSYDGPIRRDEYRWRTCFQKKGGHGARPRCGAHAFVFGLSPRDGVQRCGVMAVSDQQHTAMRAMDLSAIEVAYELGILAATIIELNAPRAAAPVPPVP